MQIDYAMIEKLHAKARRERARETYRIILRAALRLRAWLGATKTGVSNAPCCPA